MAARAVASTTISFGLVSIPSKLYTAASSEQVRFNMLQKGTGSRLKQQYVSAGDGSVVERTDTVKGYEYSRGQYVTFTDEELKALEADRGKHIEIIEFVPLSTVDFVSVEKSYYLGPDKGGDRAYQLLAECMRTTERVAVGQWAARGKEQLVLLRPYGKDGLVMHQLYYANEVRAFDQIDTGATFQFSDAERNMAHQLIEQLTVEAFDPSKYTDVYADRVKAAVEQKVAGQEVTIAAEQPHAQIIDLFEALKQSLAETTGAAAVAEAPAPKANRSKAEPKPLKKAPAAKRSSRGKKTASG
jgi:DNA end-binding protein Ku